MSYFPRLGHDIAADSRGIAGDGFPECLCRTYCQRLRGYHYKQYTSQYDFSRGHGYGYVSSTSGPSLFFLTSPILLQRRSPLLLRKRRHLPRLRPARWLQPSTTALLLRMLLRMLHFRKKMRAQTPQLRTRTSQYLSDWFVWHRPCAYCTKRSLY